MSNMAMYLTTAIFGLAFLTAIGMKFRQIRGFTVPAAIVWSVYWTMQAARQLNITDRFQLVIVAVAAGIIGTLTAVTIPYYCEDKHSA
jgi:hypothetical protein